MFLHKVNGPRSITLPDGTILSRADLPPEDTRRWVASRKAIVVKAVVHGLLSASEAKQRYGLSDDEFNSWVAAMADHGIDALKVTSMKKYRQPQVDKK